MRILAMLGLVHIVIFGAVLGSPGSAKAILLTEFSWQSLPAQKPASVGSSSLSETTQASFDLLLRDSPLDASSGLCLSGCLPNTFITGETYSIDFNSTNAVNFSTFTSRLTDGVDDHLDFRATFFGPAGTQLSGFGVGGLESQIFGGFLTGRSIDFFRLNISIDCPGGVCGNTITVFYSVQIWGEGTHLPPPRHGVPEPSSLLLLGSGLAGLVLWRRKQQPIIKTA